LSRRETISAEERHIQRFDGVHGFVLESCAPIVAPDGRLLGAVSIFADITELKKLERERADLFLREKAARERAELLQARLEVTLTSIGDAVIATDARGIV